MSEVQDIITSRRSIYRFEESPVEMASLETAFEAASTLLSQANSSVEILCSRKGRSWLYDS